MKQRVWLVDQLLRDELGHHAGYNRCIADAAFAAGYEPIIVGHRALDPGIFGSHRVEKLFRTDWRANPPAWAAGNQNILRAFEFISAVRFRADLRQFGRITASEDLVFAQMIAPRHLDAWLNWLTNSNSPPHLAIHLGYQPRRFARPETLRALQSIPDSRRARIGFVTDSEKLVVQMQSVLGVSVSYLPHVVEPRHESLAVGPARNGSVVAVALGNARREKGFGDLLGALEGVRDLLDLGKLTIRIQCHQPDLFSKRLLRERPSIPGVEWLDRPLNDGEYTTTMNKCDVVLLPYHLDHYEARTSGVFCEARVAGKPVVTTRGSWAGDRVAREGGGWLCVERDSASLAQTLRDVCSSQSRQKEEAENLRMLAEHEFSASNFFDTLSQLACPK